jgi:hypothetical protein
MPSPFLQVAIEALRPRPSLMPPADLEVSAEEVVAAGRLDLRFGSLADGWDMIVEIKIHAGYGPGQLDRYLEALSDRKHAY